MVVDVLTAESASATVLIWMLHSFFAALTLWRPQLLSDYDVPGITRNGEPVVTKDDEEASFVIYFCFHGTQCIWIAGFLPVLWAPAGPDLQPACHMHSVWRGGYRH